MEQRIQKLFSGVCSRRKAESYLAAGRVTVNGKPAVLGQKADPDRDRILLDGEPIPQPRRTVVILLHKPRGYVTTLSDERGRKTVAELVRSCGLRVYPVGRLDRDSEGLLLLTNDGDLAQRLAHPSSSVEKVYEATVAGNLSGAAARLSALGELDGEPIRPVEVSVIREKPDRAVLSLTLRQGKNRQIRRMCEQCGLRVLRLKRVREHTLELGNLPCGAWRYLTPEETAALYR